MDLEDEFTQKVVERLRQRYHLEVGLTFNKMENHHDIDVELVKATIVEVLQILLTK